MYILYIYDLDAKLISDIIVQQIPIEISKAIIIYASEAATYDRNIEKKNTCTGVWKY